MSFLFGKMHQKQEWKDGLEVGAHGGCRGDEGEEEV
jgi:hypothetical protein